jgi:diguanylate cyclase (GGDEF)-like protein
MNNRLTTRKNRGGIFVDSTDVDVLRARRVWQLVVVLMATWLFYTLYLWYRGYESAARICLVDSLLHVVLMISCWKCSNYRLILNANLVLSALGLFLVSVSAAPLAGVMMFFPVSILVASQILGVRAAMLWFVITIVAFAMFYTTVYDWETLLYTSTFDEFAVFLGVAACVYFCCQQGEAYYQRRTKNLIKLSQDLQKKSENLRHLATTDALTGLINRLQFQAALREATAHSVSNSQRMALFLLDMDGFKHLNDTMGHAVGDAALIEIANRLRREFSEESEVARLGGDEFCIIYPDVADQEHAASIARRISDTLTGRYALRDLECVMGVSVGYAMCPDHSVSDRELLVFADTAMFEAKKNRLGTTPYEPAMTERMVEHRTMRDKLSRALERNEFFLVYQPKVDLWSGKVIGVEALLRWRHDGDVIPPYRFISHLEESREIIPVGRWIVEEACRQLAEWSAANYDVSIAINVSAVQLAEEDFCASVARAIDEYAVDASRLEIEITEGLLIKDVEQAVARLQEIKRMGISISIDDFGTGYSSLAYLRQFPIDCLKIDRSFIKDIPDEDEGEIATSIVVLAKALGLKVLAEGVETEDHIEFLKRHDCDEYQGFFFSRPLPNDEVVRHFTSLDPVPVG